MQLFNYYPLDIFRSNQENCSFKQCAQCVNDVDCAGDSYCSGFFCVQRYTTTTPPNYGYGQSYGYGYDPESYAYGYGGVSPGDEGYEDALAQSNGYGYDALGHAAVLAGY